MKRRRGLTLLEVLVAGVVLSIGLLGSLEVIGRSAFTTQAVQDRTRGMMFARSKLEEILKEPVLQEGTDQGQGVDTTTDFDWEASIQATSNPALYSITVLARHRITGATVTISALRRPDLTPPAEATLSDTDVTDEPAAGQNP